jgi:3-oxosteroid 1-dehydrogenase
MEEEKKSERGISRRDFIKAAGMGAGAVVALSGVGGILSSCTSTATPSTLPAKWDYTADVVVVGSGSAASAAAVTARDGGASVIMLEKAAATGGTSAKSGGGYWIPNNSFLRAAGIQDTKEDCMRFLARGNYPVQYNPNDSLLGLPQREYDLLSAFYDNASKAIEHLAQLGALVSQSPPVPNPDYLDHVPENKVLRGRSLNPQRPAGTAGGQEMMKQLKAWIDSHNIQVLTSHRAQQIFLNAQGQVVGVQALANGATVNVRANKAVVFGSGGFTHNPELVLNFHRGPLFGGCAVPTCTGDFVNMAQAVGAQLGHMNNGWNAEIVLEQALQSSSVPNNVWQPTGDSMILVNRYGLRVCNEKRDYNDRTKAHFYWDPAEQEYPNLIMAMIYDQRTSELFAGPTSYPIPAPGATAPYVIVGQNLGELAQNIKARVNQLSPRLGIFKIADNFEMNLEAAISRFNGFANKGADDDFHRGNFPYDVEWHKNVFSLPRTGTQWPANDKPNITMYPFQPQGPYYCVLLAPGTLDTNGGPKTNALAQVLDTKDNPIPGLYGAGNCIAAPMPYYVAGGATLGPALAFGYIAGLNAVKEPVK